MANILTAPSNLFTLSFVITSMLSMGLSLTVPQIMEPLRNVRLVIMALVANFVIATGNFSSQPDVLVMLAAACLVGMLIVMPIAAEFGKHSQAGGRDPAAARAGAAGVAAR